VAGPAGVDTVVVGDASAPREALAVVYEAHRHALALPQCNNRPSASPAPSTERAVPQ
jgi:hypothetical protein